MAPAFRSPRIDNGYDISDYPDIDSMFRTLYDMERLIDYLCNHDHPRVLRA
jgi:glycosidase